MWGLLSRNVLSNVNYPMPLRSLSSILQKIVLVPDYKELANLFGKFTSLMA